MRGGRGVLAAGLVAVAAALPGAALAGEKIQPGAELRIPPGSFCTANFIFDGIAHLAGRTYVGTASHCVFDNQLGDLIADHAGKPIGRLAFFNSSLAEIADDYALIEVFPNRLADVDPSMAGHPQWPTGVSEPGDLAAGDLVQISGWGAGASGHQATREERVGALLDFSERYYDLAGPIIFGDSGGAVVHVESGKALGVVSAYCAPGNQSPGHPVTTPCVVYGPTTAEVLRRAATRGFPLRMRLAGEAAPSPPPPPAAAPAPGATPAPAPARPSTRSRAGRRAARRAACRKRARRIKHARKRKQALRRCSRL